MFWADNAVEVIFLEKVMQVLFSKENTKIGEKICLNFDSWTKTRAIGAFTSFPLDVRMGTTHMANSIDPMVRWYIKVQIPLRTSIDIVNNFRVGKPSC